MPAYVITKAIWDAVQKTAVANDHVSGLLSDASYVVVDCDTDSEFRTLPAEVIPTITITKAPSEAGLDGLVAGMTATEVLAAWTGRPLATVSNGKDPHYAHAVRIDGAQVTDLTATANLTIATTVSAAGAEDVVTLTDTVSVSTLPTVAELSAVTVRNAANPNKINVTYSMALKAGYTASVYIGVNPNGDPTYLTNLSTGVTFTSKGSYPKETYVWVYIKDKAGAIIDSAAIATLATVGADPVDPIEINVPTVPTVVELSAIATRNAADPGKIDVTYTEALRAGYTAGVYIGVNPNGDPAYQTNLSANVTFTSKDSYPSETYVWVYIKNEVAVIVDSAPIGTLAAIGADPVDPIEVVVPDVGPYTLAQIEALRTDGTTRGVTIGRTLKKVDVDTLPAGFSRSGTRITVAASADVALVENWDFTGHDFIIRGRVRLFRNCKFGFPADLQLCLIDMYPGSHIDAFKRCSFLGAGYYGSYTEKSCIRPRIGSPILTSPKIDLVERCEFFGWGGDIIKSIRGGIIRLCYFDTAINVPVGTTKWNASKAYKIGDWAFSADGKYVYSAATAGTNKHLPSAKNSNSNWQNQDPHSDTINPYFQFDPLLKIEACYINRLEATRAVDPGNPRVVGINNGIRATRDTATEPLNKVEIVNTIITKTEINEAFPFQLQRQDQANVQPAILRDSWIGTQTGGQIIHPSGRDGHTIINIQDYTNPTGLSASCGEIGTPTTGSKDGADPDLTPTPAPAPTPTSPVIDLTEPAIQLTMGQSEPALVTKSNIVQDPRPLVKAENFYFIGYDGVASLTGPLISQKLTEANKNQFNTGLVFLANALAYAVPGKQFVLAAANEQGTSRVGLYSDSAWGENYNSDGTINHAQNKNRTWEDFKMVIDEIYRLYPQGPTRISNYWWGADIGLTSNFLTEFAPFYYRQTIGGQPFNLGAKHGYRNQTMDHCIYDFNTSDPSQKGQGVIPRTVPMDMGKCLGFPGVNESRREGVQKFVDDSRFQSLSGIHGFTPYSYITDDGAHPHKKDPWGYAEAAYQFYMPSFLAAAGINIQAPKFLGVYASSDGLTAEMAFYAPNGGILSNNHRIRGGSLNTSSLGYQEVYGLEVKRASGGGRYPIVRPSASGASAIDPKYHGTVTIKDDKTAKIAMVQALQPGDEISYQRKQDSDYRTDYPSLWYNTNGHHLIAAIEHVSSYTDPSSSFPFAGFSLPVFSPSWKIVRGGYVGEKIPADGNTIGIDSRLQTH